MSREPIDIGPHTAEDLWINSIIHVLTTVILYYDYILTLPQEIEFLWPPHNKQGWFTIACLLNRYIPIVGYLPDIVSCPHYEVLCLIRVYALYGQSRRVLGFLAFTALILFVTGSGAFLASGLTGYHLIPVLSSFVGCLQFVPPVNGRRYAIAWACMSIFDILVFSLTLYKAFKIGRGIRLLDTIIRDGAMYFLYELLFSSFIDKTLTIPDSVLFIANLMNIFSLLYSPPFQKSSNTRLTNVLSTILISRLVLNLREQNSIVLHLPTTMETEHRFQAALPGDQQSMTSVEDLPSVCPSDSAHGNE
ncbi:hypothetical protein BC827DRAFT_1159434 [Russula dissimulans]|nr:hypothetical protein BC827DRAFT_1159434 [Russula dissimulans]